MESWRPGDESGLLVSRSNECLTKIVIPATLEQDPPSGAPADQTLRFPIHPAVWPNEEVQILFSRMRGCLCQT
jgi:hypothetical protein